MGFEEMLKIVFSVDDPCARFLNNLLLSLQVLLEEKKIIFLAEVKKVMNFAEGQIDRKAKAFLPLLR